MQLSFISSRLPFIFTMWIIIILMNHWALEVFNGSYLDQCLRLLLILFFHSPWVSFSFLSFSSLQNAGITARMSCQAVISQVLISVYCFPVILLTKTVRNMFPFAYPVTHNLVISEHWGGMGPHLSERSVLCGNSMHANATSAACCTWCIIYFWELLGFYTRLLYIVEVSQYPAWALCGYSETPRW